MAGSFDFSGCPTSIAPGAVAHWNATVRAFLAHGAATPDHLSATLDAAPDFAQGHAVRGLFCLLLGRREMVDTARDALTAARAAAGRSPPEPHEQVYLDALDDWLQGRPSAAAARLDALLITEPRDALAMKLVQAIGFMMGQPRRMRQSIEQILPAWGDHPALGYLQGCYAFALEETGDYVRAENMGRAALRLAPDDAWGLHAVAHVHDMTGRAEEGLAWLSGRSHAWAHCNNFRFHVWWHIALMHLDLGQIDRALALYDTEIRAERTDDYRDISNGAALLMRLELDGVDVGPRWQELADLSEARSGDGCLAFADLHYMLSLIGGERPLAAGRLLGRMASDAARAASESDRIIQRPGLTAAQGLEAFGEGNYAEAFRHLAAARPDMQRIGGSHAQRDVFERLTIEAALRSGYLDAAERMLHARKALRGGAEDGYHARRMAIIAAARYEARNSVNSGLYA